MNQRAEAAVAIEGVRVEQTALELTDNIPVGTYVLLSPLEGPQRFTFLSKRWLEMTRLDPAKVMADIAHYFTLVHPDDRESAIAYNVAGIAAGVRSWEGRWLQDGEIRWVAIESNPRRLASGETVWEGVVTDISARKQAEAQLLAAKERFHIILNHLPIAVAATLSGPERQVIFANETFTRTFGYTVADCPTMADWARCAYPDEAYRKAVFDDFDAEVARSVLENRPSRPLEYVVTCKDGTLRHVRITCIVVDGMLFGSFIDVTEQRQAEDALAAAWERERKSEEQQRQELSRKLKTSLTAAAVAHEINQPLSSILLNVNMALQAGVMEGERLDALAAHAQGVVDTIERMKVLMRSVQTKHQSTNLTQVVRSSILQVDQLAADTEVKLSLHGVEHACLINGDAQQLQLAVVNLLRNAIDAVAASAHREVTVNLFSGTDAVELVVGDSGPGWSEGVFDKIPLNSTKPGGSGIGLYVVQTAVENHGGSIAAGRSPLGGAEVRIRLPR